MRNFADPYIRSSALIGFTEAARVDDEAVAALLRAADIPAEALRNPDMMISFRRVASLFELAATRLERPSFGLEWILNMEPEFPNIGPVVYLAKFSSNLETWLQLAMRYWGHHTNAFTIKIVRDKNSELICVRWISVPDANPSRQFVEQLLASVYLVSRYGTGRFDLSPVTVRFRHRKPADITKHQEVFRCPLEFDCLHDEVVVTPYIMQLPTTGNLELFRSLLEVYVKVREALRSKPEQGVEYSVAMVISSLIGTQKCNVEETAALLGVGTKKLQRLLADEGTSFSDILEQARENTARQLLLTSDMPIANIAGFLDYSSASSFILAFKRWTGITPLAYRKEERARVESRGGALSGGDEMFLDG